MFYFISQKKFNTYNDNTSKKYNLSLKTKNLNINKWINEIFFYKIFKKKIKKHLKALYLLNFIVLKIKLLKIKNLFFINKLKRFLFILLFTIKETLNILPLLKLYFFFFLK